MRLEHRVKKLEEATGEKPDLIIEHPDPPMSIDDAPPQFLVACEELLQGCPDMRWRIGRLWGFFKHARERQSR